MKKITISVDEELYLRVRIRAAEKRSTVAALVREFLRHLVEKEPRFEQMQREQNDLIARIRTANPGFSAADRLGRNQTHGRRVVR